MSLTSPSYMDPKDLFLCHSSIDKALARRIAEDVEAADWNGRQLTVFLDEWDIGVGENIVLTWSSSWWRSARTA